MVFKTVIRAAGTAAALCLGAGLAQAQQQLFTGDVIVQGSLCVGFDCVSGESFGFDTVRLKENNIRIKFQDTSTAANFPTNDWQLTANDTANGGAERFSIDDVTNSRTPFTVEANTPNHSLYLDSTGQVGFGTSTPATQLHTKDGNTPTLRLEQDGSAGFAAQTWDIAGNEANFFVRDASNGSTLPFRIYPSAPTSSLVVEGTTGHIGLGLNSPTALLHLRRGGAGGDGLPRIRLENTDAGGSLWDIDVADNDRFRVSLDGSGQAELSITNTGQVIIPGLANCANGLMTDANGTLSCIP